MEGLEILGNAGVVPIVIFLTQLIKKKIGNFRYGSDVLALILSLILCVGWEFYYMGIQEFQAWTAMTGLATFKWGIDQLITGFATWLAASKIYDLGHGNRKKEAEKAKLQEELVKLKNGHGDNNGQDEEDPVVTDKLREILEG